MLSLIAHRIIKVLEAYFADNSQFEQDLSKFLFYYAAIN